LGFSRSAGGTCAALERIIEHVGEVDVTAQAVVTAVQAYAKINAQGQWIDRTEQVNLNELFERMTQEELEMYARDGQLPVWFTQTVVATPEDSQEVKNDT
jgi:acyl-CoA reductase-like NAD-dependent aldehyde dehydrogenase